MKIDQMLKYGFHLNKPKIFRPHGRPSADLRSVRGGESTFDVSPPDGPAAREIKILLHFSLCRLVSWSRAWRARALLGVSVVGYYSRVVLRTAQRSSLRKTVKRKMKPPFTRETRK